MIAFFMALFMVAPIVVYVLLFSFAKLMTKQHKRAVNTAIIGTTPFVIGAVYFLILSIWNIDLLWAIIITMALIGIIISFIIWKREDDLDWHKINRGFWRMNLLVFSLTHLGLIITGIVLSVMESILV
ncbi:DUF3397 domain-containing protein [Jeotgalibacillus proteolyticus]|uniref:DUF3397 domain-containing protein n=1 Tax=Jeotgalibacillus proteolyticus TaxID=2082395 RepID=UPI001FD6E637|nr:DUF3397 domain-containing protein [Jeotgalibacillus proteolyticus]